MHTIILQISLGALSVLVASLLFHYGSVKVSTPGLSVSRFAQNALMITVLAFAILGFSLIWTSFLK
jgi:hypothetical protein